jgi:hypothetical protein
LVGVVGKGIVVLLMVLMVIRCLGGGVLLVGVSFVGLQREDWDGSWSRIQLMDTAWISHAFFWGAVIDTQSSWPLSSWNREQFACSLGQIGKTNNAIQQENPKLTHNIPNTSARHSRDSNRQSKNIKKQHSVPASTSPTRLNFVERRKNV